MKVKVLGIYHWGKTTNLSCNKCGHSTFFSQHLKGSSQQVRFARVFFVFIRDNPSWCEAKIACVAGVKEGGGEGQEREEGNACYQSRVFFISPLISITVSQLSLQRPIRIRHTLFCMTDFARECIAKGGFAAVDHEKIFATECRRPDSYKNL